MGKWAAQGHGVHVSILGEGITSRYANRCDADASQIAELHARSQQAGRIVGAKEVSLHSLPDNRFDTVPLLDVVKIIEELIGRLKPEIVYTQHGGDLNIDHAITYRATLTATRPTRSHVVRAVYAYEVASSTEWAFQQFSPPFQPNVFVNIEETLEAKIRAMECYESEAREFPHPRSPEGLRAQARRWGTVAGFPAAEAFALVRQVCP
jgi:LmbE family N-acetylglucosaminyl deacetylase